MSLPPLLLIQASGPWHALQPLWENKCPSVCLEINLLGPHGYFSQKDCTEKDKMEFCNYGGHEIYCPNKAA